MATFGKLTDGASNSTSSADSKIASSASPSTNGTVQSLTARVWVSSGTSATRAIIYSDAAGVPGNLLAVSADLTVSNTTEAANTFTFSGANAINIVAGTTYWIGVHFADPGLGNYTWSRDATAGAAAKATDAFADGTTATWGTNSALAGPIDFYVTYTESGGAPANMGKFFMFFN